MIYLHKQLHGSNYINLFPHLFFILDPNGRFTVRNMVWISSDTPMPPTLLSTAPTRLMVGLLLKSQYDILLFFSSYAVQFCHTMDKMLSKSTLLVFFLL